MGQVVTCAPVTQRARVRSPVGTSFLGEVFSGFSSPVRQMSGSFRPPRSPNIILPSLLSSIIIRYGRQWPDMLTRPKTSNIHRLHTYCINLFLFNYLILYEFPVSLHHSVTNRLILVILGAKYSLYTHNKLRTSEFFSGFVSAILKIMAISVADNGTKRQVGLIII